MEVGIDITEQKKAQEALKNAHALLEERIKERTKELREQMNISVTFEQRKCPIVVWNPTWRLPGLITPSKG